MVTPSQGLSYFISLFFTILFYFNKMHEKVIQTFMFLYRNPRELVKRAILNFSPTDPPHNYLSIFVSFRVKTSFNKRCAIFR